MAELREALESAINEAETKEPVAASSPVESPAPAQEADVAAASAVDAPSEPVQETKAAEQPSEAPAPSPDKTPAPEAQASDQPEAPKSHRVDRAPQSWKGQAKGEWAQLPLHVRQEVQRRENEINRALQETAPARQFAQQFEKVVTPYMARLQAAGAQNPMQAVEALLQADYTLSSAPKAQRAAYMAKLIKEYDIDVVALDDALVGKAQQQQQPQVPDIDAIVQQRLNQALAPLYQQQNAQRQARQQQINHTVETMALDPKYPHFDEVRLDMADLVDSRARRGIDLSLEQAYDMAVRMNPGMNTQMNANQQHLQAQRAKNAASSVSGSPASGGSMASVGNGSLRGALEAAFGGARL